jgi:hypothetical protein
VAGGKSTRRDLAQGWDLGAASFEGMRAPWVEMTA